MSDPDRLAEIKARMAERVLHPGERADVGWLVGAVERLWAEVANLNAALQAGIEAAADETSEVERLQLRLDHDASIHQQVVAERDRLRALPARLEWAGQLYHNVPACPACGAMKGHVVGAPGPHDPGCWLAAVLHPEREETPVDPRGERRAP